MAAHGVKTLIYSSTCATYGEPDIMPITEETPQVNFWFVNCLVSTVFLLCALTPERGPFRCQSTHMVRPRRWQKISFWISRKTQIWQLWS